MQLIRKFLGRKLLHSLFVRLHKISLWGMNYGAASFYGENGEISAFKRLLKNTKKQEWIIFDVGANEGTYTLNILKVIKDRNYHLHAFEPSPNTFKKLSEAIPASDKVHLWNFGLSDQPGELVLHADEKNSTLSSVYKRDLTHIGKPFNHQETIAVDTLDNFCRQHNIAQIDFLKLDVEGHEISVLKGAHDLLENNSIHMIQFEFGGGNIDSKTYFKDFYWLLNKKYRLYRILRDGLFEITAYNERLEIFQSSNFLAVHRDVKN